MFWDPIVAPCTLDFTLKAKYAVTSPVEQFDVRAKRVDVSPLIRFGLVPQMV